MHLSTTHMGVPYLGGVVLGIAVFMNDIDLLFQDMIMWLQCVLAGAMCMQNIKMLLLV